MINKMVFLCLICDTYKGPSVRSKKNPNICIDCSNNKKKEERS